MSEPVLELIEVMDRLRSPGGCPWDAAQTHRSLVEYLLEECHETIESIELGDDAALREELGDLLLQVVFHARIGQEAPEPWDIDDVARGIVDKLVRRHPHVFGDASAADAAEVAENWTRMKTREKGRRSAVEGVPMSLPALALAQKSWRRAQESGVRVSVPGGEDLGARLLALVVEAEERGVDAESALRSTIRELHEAIRAAEESGAGPRE